MLIVANYSRYKNIILFLRESDTIFCYLFTFEKYFAWIKMPFLLFVYTWKNNILSGVNILSFFTYYSRSQYKYRCIV